MNSKIREQTDIKWYANLGTLLLQFKDPGVTVGTDLGKVEKRNWMNLIHLLLLQK
jgi:hypothetical protein